MFRIKHFVHLILMQYGRGKEDKLFMVKQGWCCLFIIRPALLSAPLSDFAQLAGYKLNVHMDSAISIRQTDIYHNLNSLWQITNRVVSCDDRANAHRVPAPKVSGFEFQGYICRTTTPKLHVIRALKGERVNHYMYIWIIT